ncbi:hypothetical protein AGDE_03045 [Angomonas deanei]|uniref:Uncharacterized protein n=1 Tax=Angomonas deanei TaxID=59799 RepID=A0A7G2CB94_9TRYP|nr:hypothetical protein AGDE_03045 [Angomonas deanei]CAD2216204.1 hypothetical protein, conserved [Angomonas deanei]|eukprot:EPY40881.1 hypothetical protein AGDE_03045 [Angomonas deanei]
MAINAFSLLFNSVEMGAFRIANFFSCLSLILMLRISNECYGVMNNPLLGAKIGAVSSFYWTVGLRFRLIYTQRFLSRGAHYAIGSAYTGYHLYQWWALNNVFEDAGEDRDEDF